MRYVSPFECQNSNEIAPSKSRTYFAVEVRLIKEGFRGLFTLEFIPEGAVFACDGGVVVSSLDDDAFDLNYLGLIDEKLWLAPSDLRSLEPIYFVNHSCEPNILRYGGLVYISNRDILPGEQITMDYAPLISDHDDFQFECNCSSNVCRKKITSSDWKEPILARKLWSEWLPFIQRKIIRMKLLTK